jgi:hypothetical protein
MDNGAPKRKRGRPKGSKNKNLCCGSPAVNSANSTDIKQKSANINSDLINSPKSQNMDTKTPNSYDCQ